MDDKRETAVAVAAPVASTQMHYTDWGAIFAGAAVGSAVAFILTAFGTALGLSLISPFSGDRPPGMAIVIAIGLWFLWVAGTSFLAGGYVTGRLRRRINDATEHEVDVRDGLHGAIMWGVATLLGAGLLALGVYGTGSLVTRGAQAAAPVAAAAAAGEARDGADGPNFLTVERMFAGGDEMTKPGGDLARRSATRVLAAAVVDGKLADADRAYLAKLVAARSGVPEPDAQARVDQAFKDAQAAALKAKQAANAARKVGIVGAFIIAASLLLGLVAAWFAAGLGGRHRDKQVVFAWVQWR